MIGIFGDDFVHICSNLIIMFTLNVIGNINTYIKQGCLFILFVYHI